MYFKKVEESIIRLPSKILALIFKEIKDNVDALAVRNRVNLFSGLDSNLRAIQPPYTPTTQRIKQRKGQPINRVTLRDTGDFYRGIDAVFNTSSKEINITSSDDKTSDLEDKYGDALIGVSDIDIDWFRDLLLEEVRNGLKSKL